MIIQSMVISYPHTDQGRHCVNTRTHIRTAPPNTQITTTHAQFTHTHLFPLPHTRTCYSFGKNDVLCRTNSVTTQRLQMRRITPSSLSLTLTPETHTCKRAHTRALAIMQRIAEMGGGSTWTKRKKEPRPPTSRLSNTHCATLLTQIVTLLTHTHYAHTHTTHTHTLLSHTHYAHTHTTHTHTLLTHIVTLLTQIVIQGGEDP